MSEPVIVVGAGPVGLAFAAAVGERVLLLEAATQPPPPPADDFDHRVYALSPGSRRFLERIGAWSRIAPERVARVDGMEVHGDARGALSFGDGREPVAWIVEAARLQAALQQVVDERPGVTLRRDAAICGVLAHADGVEATLAKGETVRGSLLVGADGADSGTRRQLGLDARVDAYGEMALVANFDCERPHGQCARQWFRHDGVLAWLPLPGTRISIVWSTPDTHAQELQDLDAAAFAQRVRDAGRGVLGDLRLASPRAAFALRRVIVPRTVQPGAALIGDAAHGIHPLAGQGVNLGLRDADSLAATIGTRTALERPGDLALLRRHERARRGDVAATQLTTHGLDRLFSRRDPVVGRLRNAGLRLVDLQGWAKSALARRAMR